MSEHTTNENNKNQIYIDPRHKEHSFDLPFWRDNEKLWALDVPIEDMDINELLWIFEIPFWEDEKGNITITPQEVIQNPEAYPYHRDRVQNSDTSFALDIMKNKKGRWLTLDGLHRLVKLALKGEKVVRVRKIPPHQVHLTAREPRESPAVITSKGALDNFWGETRTPTKEELDVNRAMAREEFEASERELYGLPDKPRAQCGACQDEGVACPHID